ncbi:ABC transporter permease [Corynebacterium choanae]|uniref:ABC-2 family transporter protein n=1 Tax=Corynebacterium choanae TaxID=1862358 RepID=A0A3G6JAV4_9CORY|nr:ABC transporter permease [Corynebacterium choanae]AZA13620.1 ABC-2 family transporter protein [Corynebacterium choanae]
MTVPSSTPASSRFAPGTFTPQPQRASLPAMVAAQAKIESLLFLRHGEQQLLSLIIPLLLLISLTLIPIGGTTVHTIFPLTLAISAMSAGFTGQAIAVAFDRRYGALKRIGASGVPAWTIICGKAIGVWAVSVVQTIILGTTALLLGWRAPLGAILIGLVVLAIGVATFTALGLLLGGTLSSEIVLALGNLLWFLLAGAASYAVIRATTTLPLITHLVPSIALAESLTGALTGSINLLDIAILLGWMILGGIAAAKTFRFND